MRTIYVRRRRLFPVVLLLIVYMFGETRGFVRPAATSWSISCTKQLLQQQRQHSQTLLQRKAILDPSELASAVVHGVLRHTYGAGTETTIDTLASTMYTATISSVAQQDHLQSSWLFGPANLNIATAKSIAPPAGALLDMGIEPYVTPASEKIQSAVSNGWKILDAASIAPTNILPGFQPTHGVLPQHNAQVLPDSPASFALQVEWAARIVKVIEKLPYIALFYGLIEFFLLRPGLDVYKDDIEDESSEIMEDTIATVGVRLGIFAVLAVATMVLYG
jgi:hypothetical protein